MTRSEVAQTPRLLKDRYGTPPELIQNGRVILRRWRLEDAEALLAAVSESLPELQKWMPFARNGYSMKDAKDFLSMATDRWNSGSEYNFAFVVDNKVSGSFGLMSPIRGDAGMGLGYWIATPVTNRGLATEATSLLTQTAYSIGAELVQIWHQVGNERSKKVPERLGYEFVGEFEFPGVSTPGRHGLWQMEKSSKV